MNRAQFRRIIWRWYKKNKRDFPWRRTHNPYKILVSEIMLQQTQTSRVEEKYPIFIKTFPSFRTLAHAPLRKILKAWQGMGYNRRALYLKQLAKVVEKRWQGKLPSNIHDLETLPGIGSYTSRAVACFAFKKCEPFLDTNIRRVFIHFFFLRKKKVRDEEILEKIRETQPRQNAREWYLTLMDYGASEFSKIPNPNRKSIAWHRQSPFPGSRRFVRSFIIKRLLKKAQTAKELLAFIKTIKGAEKFRSRKQLVSILNELKREGLLADRNPLWKIS